MPVFYVDPDKSDVDRGVKRIAINVAHFAYIEDIGEMRIVYLDKGVYIPTPTSQDEIERRIAEAENGSKSTAKKKPAGKAGAE